MAENLEQRIRELEIQMEELAKGRGRNELGSPNQPIRVIYLLDPNTQAVGKIVFDRSATDISVEEN